MLKKTLPWTVTGLAAAAAVAVTSYARDIRKAYRRVYGKSAVLSSPYGDIEYAAGGEGPAVLVIHGSGGGFDQGQLMTETFLSSGFHWIAPSRFGYLRSTFHEGATFDDQAHAYAVLLDHLEVERVAVVALSHGGPSALLFAALHPERVSSLTLLSAGVASAATEDQGMANQKGTMLVTLYRHDWLYWAMTKLFKKQFMGLMGASDEVISELAAEQRELAERVIDEMNPASLRRAGTEFDNRAALPGDRIAAIQSPTLIIHAEDDLLQLYRNAEFATDMIPGAKLMRFERGGHLLMVVEQPTIRAALRQHILDNAG